MLTSAEGGEGRLKLGWMEIHTLQQCHALEDNRDVAAVLDQLARLGGRRQSSGNQEVSNNSNSNSLPCCCVFSSHLYHCSGPLEVEEIALWMWDPDQIFWLCYCLSSTCHQIDGIPHGAPRRLVRPEGVAGGAWSDAHDELSGYIPCPSVG